MAEPGTVVDREDADLHDAAEDRGDLMGLACLTGRLFAALALLMLLSAGVAHGEDEASDSGIYHLAVDYCRASVPRPMALSSDQRVLCLDGWVDDGMDLSAARDLKEFGLFVVRSLGGHDATAVALAHMLRDRHATVVIYDFCISACANYFFIASDQTYVVADALVAWHGFAVGSADCTSSKMSRDQETERIERVPCPGMPRSEVAKYHKAKSALIHFYSERTVAPMFDAPPQSFHVSRTLKNLYALKGSYPNVGWTLNPRYHTAFKTKIVYEAYPKSQEDVDALAARLQLGKVIYDP
jgi:hypothetical protein